MLLARASEILHLTVSLARAGQARSVVVLRSKRPSAHLEQRLELAGLHRADAPVRFPLVQAEVWQRIEPVLAKQPIGDLDDVFGPRSAAQSDRHQLGIAQRSLPLPDQLFPGLQPAGKIGHTNPVGAARGRDVAEHAGFSRPLTVPPFTGP